MDYLESLVMGVFRTGRKCQLIAILGFFTMGKYLEDCVSYIVAIIVFAYAQITFGLEQKKKIALIWHGKEEINHPQGQNLQERMF